MELPRLGWIVFYRWSRINPIWSYRTLARIGIPIEATIAVVVRAIRFALATQRSLNRPGGYRVKGARNSRDP